MCVFNVFIIIILPIYLVLLIVMFGPLKDCVDVLRCTDDVHVVFIFLGLFF